jgi:hypothetical protein
MIVFKPKHENHNTGTIPSFNRNFTAIAEKKLCGMLNEKEVSLKCETHSSEESEIFIDMSVNAKKYTIGSYCCEEFKSKLERFISSQLSVD